MMSKKKNDDKENIGGNKKCFKYYFVNNIRQKD